MGVYIKGMEMPDYGYVCLKVFANGEVLMTKEHRGALVITGIKDKVGTAIPVPPHGRLIDADAELKRLKHCMFPSDMVTTTAVGMYEEWLKNAPTIIPADKEGE